MEQRRGEERRAQKRREEDEEKRRAEKRSEAKERKETFTHFYVKKRILLSPKRKNAAPKSSKMIPSDTSGSQK